MTPEMSERLERLDALFKVNTTNGQTRKQARYEVRLPAALRVRGRELEVTVTDLGGGGLRVTPAPTLPVGKKTTIFIAADSGAEYAYEVAAGWVQRSGDGGSMGMPFVGIPRHRVGA